MPLSSVLGASTLIKPGVVTSSTRPAVPYEGQLIYETDTDRIAAYNGSTWVTQNGLQLITSASFTSVSSVSLPTNTFTSTYDNYKIIIRVTSFSTSASLGMRFRTNGTDNTADAYRYGTLGYYSTGATSNANGDAGTTQFANLTESPTYHCAGEITIFSPLATNDVKHITSQMNFSRASAPYFAYRTYGASINSTAVFDAVTFLASAGNMTGTYKVYGIANN